VTCPSCGTENPVGQKFCGECGTPLAAVCPSCGTTNPPGQKFCGECGTPLADKPATATAGPPTPSAEAPTAERRLVSVLFADLVGFTTLSESRDAEEVRELLSRYFDLSRTVIARYGGTVEKFIGDAVMAVWGTPVAQEDDAERGVRAALDLVALISDLGHEIGAPDLRARAGVLTGEAAVTIGAEGEGMVAGDLVNTASRIQAAAEPGVVLVGEATRRSTEAAITYEDAGSHELKGKADPLRLWRAIRVVAGVGGALKSAGLEAPFVGRDRELRTMKELFHAVADESKAHLVSIIGIAGIGKSRLGWEYYKYSDGLSTVFWWHRGRCLAYGEGVTYWALAEMVRGRAEIIEGEGSDVAHAKLRAAVEQWVSDPDERRWVEPRLAHLIGLEERTARDRDDLFAGWRLFFERMAEQAPVVMSFEDMQWADDALLDFIEYLLEWSRSLPIFIMTQARPDLLERRPDWGRKRSATTLYLEPLPEESMRELLAGLVPGLPDELRDQILGRAEGIPLYAVETVRMLLDRGLLVPEGNSYRPAGEIGSLDVPETLHALIAARLDGLAPEERRLLQDASVLGKTFTVDMLAALIGEPEERLESLLTGLVRKEVLGIQADPRSPERGQYGFLQDLVKRVAYETVSRKERKRNTWPSRHSSSQRGPPRRTTSSRSSPPITSMRTTLSPMRRMHRRSRTRPRACWPALATGRRRWPRACRPCITTSRLSTWLTIRSLALSSASGPAGWPGRTAGRERLEPTMKKRSPPSIRSGSITRQLVSPPRSPRSRGRRDVSKKAWSRWNKHSPFSPGRNRMPISPPSPRSLAGSSISVDERTKHWSGSSSHSTSRRRSVCRRRSRRLSTRRASSLAPTADSRRARS
jgi:class 3 adenylate cyclase